MQAMAANGEIGALVPERVWREMERAMGEGTPEAFIDTLDGCGALPIVLPELRWESEDREALRAAARLSNDASIRFAALVAGSGIPEIESLCKRRPASANWPCCVHGCGSTWRRHRHWTRPICSICSMKPTPCAGRSASNGCC
jgi:hypothetical protein